MLERLADNRVARYVDSRIRICVEDLWRSYGELEGRVSRVSLKWLNWKVRESEQTIGLLHATLYDSGEAVVAYALGPSHWERGLAREAVAAMIDYIATNHDPKILLASVNSADTRSVSLLEHLRFSPASAREAERYRVGDNSLLYVARS